MASATVTLPLTMYVYHTQCMDTEAKELKLVNRSKSLFDFQLYTQEITIQLEPIRLDNIKFKHV